MKTYRLELEILSDTIIGSAESANTTIDNDIMFNELGVPYIPAKRVKGVLREAVEDVLDILKNLSFDISLPADSDTLLGKKGETENVTRFYISDLFLSEYQENREYLEYFIKERVIGVEEIQDHFTTLRMQTSIDNDKRKGIAKKHSLRTSRVLKKGYRFSTDLSFNEEFETLMGIACLAVKRMGTKRNRGFGEVSLRLCYGTREIGIPELKALRGEQ